MKLLLDTHALVWALTAPDRLTSRGRDLLTDQDNRVLVSTVCAYEIEFKRQRSPELAMLPADLDEGVALMDFEWLPILSGHAAMAGRLPRLHGDPFDRMMVAQGLAEQALIVSSDPALARYGGPVVW